MVMAGLLIGWMVVGMVKELIIIAALVFAVLVALLACCFYFLSDNKQKDAQGYRAFADFNGSTKEECKDEQEYDDVLIAQHGLFSVT